MAIITHSTFVQFELSKMLYTSLYECFLNTPETKQHEKLEIKSQQKWLIKYQKRS
jgi:hypothetical protein